MKRNSWAALAAIVAITMAILLIRMSNRNTPPDEIMILRVVDKGRTAIEHKNLQGALSLISSDYSDSAGMNSDRLRAYVVQAFRSNEKYGLRLSQTRVRVQGSMADVYTQLTISGTFDGETHQVFDGPVHITLRQEHTRRWLVVPQNSWKVIGMTGLPTGIQE